MEKKRVLVVDDERDFLTITKLNLEETGRFEVMTLPNAKHIISKMHTFRPDLILLDALMPGLGGLDACKLLNENPIGSSTPIIILSALDSDKDKLNAYKVGVVDYLTKPIEKDTLIAKIDKAIQSKNSKT